MAKKEKKAKSNASSGQFARNKQDRAERQKKYWNEQKVAKYQVRRLKTLKGNRQNYRIRVDKRGRTYIADMGADAPEGYYSDGSRYYKLKRNARITQDSTPEQKAWYFTHQNQIYGVDRNKAGGYLDNAGRQGMIAKSKEDSAVSEVNLRKTQGGRKSMDKTKAYYGRAGANKSQYIFKIGQDGREA